MSACRRLRRRPYRQSRRRPRHRLRRRAHRRKTQQMARIAPQFKGYTMCDILLGSSFNSLCILLALYNRQAA